MADINDLVVKISIWTLPLLFAITLHEWGHAWAANKLGDPTARLLGRISLNPVRHIDPVGTILVPLVLLIVGGFVFGWAKPVPVDERNLREPRRDMALVALAGPGANLVMAFGWGVAYLVATNLHGAGMTWVSTPLALMARVGIILNVVLAVLNMLPLPPLDGSAIIAWLMPKRMAISYLQIAPFGLFLLVALVASGLLGRIVNPPVQAMVGFLFRLFGVA